MEIDSTTLKFHFSMKLYYSIKSKSRRNDKGEYETLFFLPLIAKSKYQWDTVHSVWNFITLIQPTYKHVGFCYKPIIHTRYAIQAYMCGFFVVCLSQTHRSHIHLKVHAHKKSQRLLATALKFNFKTDNPNQHWMRLNFYFPKHC